MKSDGSRKNLFLDRSDRRDRSRISPQGRARITASEAITGASRSMHPAAPARQDRRIRVFVIA
jgi:hypothetical protein